MARKLDQKQELQDAREQWKKLPKGAKVAVIIIAVIGLFVSIGILSGSSGVSQSSDSKGENSQQSSETKKEEQKSKSTQELMFEKISNLITSKKAFDTGSYIKGEVPGGEYAFISFDGSGKYYSEEDGSGSIIDNENFDSFGYVHVHSAGNLQTEGLLVRTSAFKNLGVKGAKELYEELNNVSGYWEGAWYKVGVDLKPGTYTLKSYGEGYVAIMSGPVGNSDIVDNEIFNGKYSVTVRSGQYLNITTAKILK